VINPNGETFSFRYDPLARIMEKKNGSSSTKYSWDGVALLGEVGDESGVVDYTFLPGSFLPLGFTKDEKHYAILFDHLGSPFLVCGSTGEALWRPDSLAYGQVKDDSGNNQWDPRLRFQGQYFDRELKVTYNRARYFDQRLGRFVEPDPIGLAGGLNFYLHGPNPINWIDPFGLYQCKIVPKCSWVKNRRLMKEARKKIRAANKRIGKGVNIPKKPPTRCGKTAKSIYEKCQEQNKKMRDLKETSDPCTNEQADHMLEVILTGEEKECKNLHPLNEHVNKSFGSQVKNCASEMRSTGDLKLTKIVLLSPKKQCSEGGAC
jgi:RHS repeat-associated protein